MAQWKSSLTLEAKFLGHKNRQPYRKVGVRNALRKGKRRFIAITSDEKGTCIFVDGRLEISYADFAFLPKDRDFSNLIILRNSAIGKEHCAGSIFGLAIHERSLTAEQILQHFQDSVNGKPPSVLKGDNHRMISYFIFNERTGTRIQDQINHHDLLMPSRFNSPQKVILSPL